MAGEKIIKPDLQFVKRVVAAGGETVKKCYQCDTCSVVCNLAPDNKPFPRKEMLMTQWGMQEVLKSPDIWLCHQCSDCTALCPRGAKPGEVLGVLRQMAIEKYAGVPYLPRMVGDYRYLPLLIALPVMVFYVLLNILGKWGIPDGPIVYAKLFPTLLVDFIFVPAFFCAVFVLFKGVMAYWNDLNAGDPWKTKVSGNLVGNLIETLKEIIFHQRFRECEATYARATNHLFLVFGFIFLAIVTSWGFMNEWVLHHDSPYAIYEPIKLLAIAGTAAMLYGIWNIIKERKANADKAGYGTYFDLQFIYVVFTVGATGLLSWLFRLIGIKTLAYPTYFIHLVSVFFLFFYAPYSKAAHMVYRTVAMLYASMSSRGF